MRGFIWICLLGLGAVNAAAAAEFSFGLPHHLTLARNNAASVAIGDANGDGRMDLAVTEDLTTDKHQLSLFVQKSDGTLAPPVTMSLPVEFFWGSPVAFADLDGDGSDEIMVGTTRLIVARLVGSALTTIIDQPAKYDCRYLASGDIDGDGATDMVCHSGAGIPTAATMFYGDGAGGVRARTEMLTDAGSYGVLPDFMSIQLADVTGDARPDLLVTASRVQQFFVYPNNGLGGFTAKATAYDHPSSPLQVWPAAIQVLDIDGDGVNEVVTASPGNQPDAKLNVYRRGASGLLALFERRAIYDSTTALAAGDIDGDGDTELLAGHYGFNAVTVFGADSSGITRQARFDLPGFGNNVELNRLIGHSKSLALGDLNGDGCVDLAGATYSGVTLLYGCRPFINRLPVSDFDGDGVSDLLWRRGVGELFLWQWADQRASFGCALPCPVYKVPPWTLQITGDFDGDGNSDTFWRNSETGENAILRSAFYERALIAVTSQDWQVVGAGDFDGDDRSDLLWRNSRTGGNAIWRSGDKRSQLVIRAVADLGWQVAGIGDFNGDGRSDILWRHATSRRGAIWLSGRAETLQPIWSVTNPLWHIRGVGDFNGDGKDDIVWQNVGTGANTIWLGADYRTQQALKMVTNMDWKIAAVADYNGDGRSDLMWHNGVTRANVIWRSGRYETQQSVAPAMTGLVPIP